MIRMIFATVILLVPLKLIAAPREITTVARNIDQLINKQIQENKLSLSPRSDDAEFIRRLSLDIRGRIPKADRVQSFLDDQSSDKRVRLIDEFLADTEYGEHFAIIWYHRMIKIDDDNRLLIRENTLQNWLASNFNKNRPWNELVRDILLASGNRETHPETTFFLAHVDDNKGLHRPAPNKITSAVSKLFLGIRLECCECHNHPFNSMKQTDYWGVAAFFSDLHAAQTGNKNAKDGDIPRIFDGSSPVMLKKKNKKKGGYGITAIPFGAIAIPDTNGQMMRARYLEGSDANVSTHPNLRRLFVNWVIDSDNKYFAQAAVNKLWANFFGTGLCNPVDDIDPEKVTHPELLRMLAQDFASSNYDIKWLIRCICVSDTYQRSSQVVPGNKEDTKLYSHMRLKVMSADMLYDSLEIVLGHNVTPLPKKVTGAMNNKGIGTPRERFRNFFHAEADDDVGVVEDYTHGVPQVLRLMNDPIINRSNATIYRLMKAGSPEKIIESIFVTVLSRKPTARESHRMLDFLAKEGATAKSYNDIFWILLNTGEFLFIH